MQRLTRLQSLFDIYQRRFIVETFELQKIVPIRSMSRAFGYADAFLSYFIVIKVRRLLKTPTIEEGGSIQEWTLKEKIQAIEGGMQGAEWIGLTM